MVRREFMLKQLFRTTSLDALIARSLPTGLPTGEAPQHQLKRTLGAFDVVMLGIGAIVGAGIFATIGTAAAGDPTRPGAGPALILSFVLTGIACGFAALCYAEFAAMVPISGSAYTYAYATLGELVAWIIGWDLIIEYAVGNVAVAISWGNYFKTLVSGLGIVIPDWLSTDYRTAAHIPGLLASAPHLFGVPIVFNILAFGIVAAITVVLVIGIRESATINTTMVLLKLVVLGFFVVVGWNYTKGANFHPFAPNGWAGVQAGAAIVFFAYIGFDAVSTVAEETRNPKRDLPIGIIGSLVICTVIYIVVAVVFTGIIPYSVLRQKLATEQAEPLTMALQYANIGKWSNLFVGVVAFGSVVAHTAVLLVFQLGQPRIFFSMARDGLLPPSFARVHPRFRTPYVTTILTGVAVGVCAMFTSIDEMVDLTNIGTLFAFTLVCVGILILRTRDPERPRAFRTPWVPMVPVLGVSSCLYLMLGLPWITWIRFALWLVVGLVVYFSYGFRRSALQKATGG
jgi:APA family basic amino acid/polyamine antiporter